MSSPDYTWDVIPTYYWCYVEVGAGIVCSSVPALRPLASRYMRSVLTRSRGAVVGSEENAPEMPYSSVLSMNRKRRATRDELHELNIQDGISILHSSKQEVTVVRDDEERLWPTGESRKELELHPQSTYASSNGALGTDDGSSSTLGVGGAFDK
ncbi:hypothetical protein KVR01_012304 [Diaporthe batatas]|uniref:uncharacterized protein n=1 Tax=Diaporthe batatas TaxID=748121 RepID=UPI001D05877E|nr:uncharacterized protein KVR01_012304 [Diaporthe batatas]KAG8158032.1 hypothetical protein KVR01_012304 [Diaporthe batatas]